MNSQMPFVATEQFIRPLTNQGNLDILSRALRDEVHRNNRRSCDRFFETFHDLWKRAFEFGLIKLHRYVLGAKKGGSLGRISQLIISECLAIADRVCGPGTALLIHQSQEQARVEAAAQKYSDWHIAQKVAANRRPI